MCEEIRVEFYSQESNDLDFTVSEEPTLYPMVLSMISRPETFACLAYFETGTVNVNPADLKLALAMCCDDSIYVADIALSDPLAKVPDWRIRRIVGNIGHAGISMLIAPRDVQIRELTDDFNIVTHAIYDLEREDNFKDTSLHLSFTDWKRPLITGNNGAIDSEVFLVESVISVLERGNWVADLDILAIDFEKISNLKMSRSCPGHDEDGDLIFDYTSIDCWEELLDPPPSVGIFRAHGNWAARLAAVSIMWQKGLGAGVGVYGPEKFCLKCMEYECRADRDREIEDATATLPKICID